MADQFVLGHAHCKLCGACLLFPAQKHKCPERARPDILEVMLLDMKPWDGGRTRKAKIEFDGRA